MWPDQAERRTAYEVLEKVLTEERTDYALDGAVVFAKASGKLRFVPWTLARMVLDAALPGALLFIARRALLGPAIAERLDRVPVPMPESASKVPGAFVCENLHAKSRTLEAPSEKGTVRTCIVCGAPTQWNPDAIARGGDSY